VVKSDHEIEEIQMNTENQKATGLVELTEAETDRVSGGNNNGNHYGEYLNGNNGNHYGQIKNGNNGNHYGQ
jgi:hypothetical protein